MQVHCKCIASALRSIKISGSSHFLEQTDRGEQTETGMKQGRADDRAEQTGESLKQESRADDRAEQTETDRRADRRRQETTGDRQTYQSIGQTEQSRQETGESLTDRRQDLSASTIYAQE